MNTHTVTDEKPRSHDVLWQCSLDLLNRKLEYAQEHYVRCARSGARIAAAMYAREITDIEDELDRRYRKRYERYG